jgi:hypothetical protein
MKDESVEILDGGYEYMLYSICKAFFVGFESFTGK